MSARFVAIHVNGHQGCYAVERRGDALLTGVISSGPAKGRRWARPPYYGHVARRGARRWIVSPPGAVVCARQLRDNDRTFPTRAAAAAALLKLGVSA